MANMPNIQKKLTELKQEQHDKTVEVQEINTKIQGLIKEWQKGCSHPEEYIEASNKTGEDDYGFEQNNPESEWINTCIICNKVMEK